MEIIFTDKQIAFIKANRLKMTSTDMAVKLKCSKSKMQTWLAKHNLKPPKKIGIAMRIAKNKASVTFTPSEDKIIKSNYLIVAVKPLATMLGRVGESALKRRLKQLGLKIPLKIVEQRKKDSQIKPGHVPMNKGKKMAQYCSRETIRRIKKTQFKKGQKPKNTLYDGAIQIRHNHKERGARPYKYIRIREGYWEMLHVHNWKKKHGDIPTGHIIVFRNGDTMNCSVSNLKCITRQQHAANTRNTDGYIATRLSHIPGGKGLIDLELREEILKDKQFIQAKRLSLLLKKTINDRETNSGKA